MSHSVGETDSGSVFLFLFSLSFTVEIREEGIKINGEEPEIASSFYCMPFLFQDSLKNLSPSLPTMPPDWQLLGQRFYRVCYASCG